MSSSLLESFKKTFSILNPGNGTETIGLYLILYILPSTAFSILNPGNGTETVNVATPALPGKFASFSILNPGNGTETCYSINTLIKVFFCFLNTESR